MGSPPVISTLPEQTRLDRLSLNVGSLQAMRDFYRDVIGLRELAGSADLVEMGGEHGTLIELRATPDGPPRRPATSGLFHLALLEPDRASLARSLRRLVNAGARLAGASDHLVSEALYLSDPEGNGIEIYRDRPADQWRWVNGEVEMATLPLDLNALLAEADDSAAGSDAILGHVHLNVAELEAGRRFYSELVGFDVTSSTYPGALFVAAGGYHHQIGMNIWSGSGVPAPPLGSLGISQLTIELPGIESLDLLEQRLQQGGVVAQRVAGALVATDPSGIVLRFIDRAAGD